MGKPYYFTDFSESKLVRDIMNFDLTPRYQNVT